MKRARCPGMSPAEPFGTVCPSGEARGDEVVDEPLNVRRGSSDAVSSAKVESSIDVVVI